MLTQKEFLEIVEKHLIIRNDGSICIKDTELAKKYAEYLKQFAIKGEPSKDINIINCECKDILCW